MKKKIISNTYLRDIEKYQFKLYLDEDDYYIAKEKAQMEKNKKKNKEMKIFNNRLRLRKRSKSPKEMSLAEKEEQKKRHMFNKLYGIPDDYYERRDK